MKGASILAGLRSGDGPLSVRVRPSSLKRDRDRRGGSRGSQRQAHALRAHSRRVPQMSPNRYEQPTVATSSSLEPEAGAASEPVSNAREHARNA
jgi:hypothetical protein